MTFCIMLILSGYFYFLRNDAMSFIRAIFLGFLSVMDKERENH